MFGFFPRLIVKQYPCIYMYFPNSFNQQMLQIFHKVNSNAKRLSHRDSLLCLFFTPREQITSHVVVLNVSGSLLHIPSQCPSKSIISSHATAE